MAGLIGSWWKPFCEEKGFDLFNRFPEESFKPTLRSIIMTVGAECLRSAEVVSSTPAYELPAGHHYGWRRRAEVIFLPSIGTAEFVRRVSCRQRHVPPLWSQRNS